MMLYCSLARMVCNLQMSFHLCKGLLAQIEGYLNFIFMALHTILESNPEPPGIIHISLSQCLLLVIFNPNSWIKSRKIYMICCPF